MLLGGGPAHRERAAVADGLDAELDRDGGVAGAHEVAVQGVHETRLLDRTAGGDQRLTGHLPAEHPLRAHLGALADEGGRVDLLQVEDVEKLIDGGLPVQRRHAELWSVSEPSWCTRRVLVEPGAFGGEPATTTT